MKNVLYYILVCLICVAALSCDKNCDVNADAEFDYMVFGHFYGECGGEQCVEIFKMDANHLYEDSNDTYPNSEQPYEGMFASLPDDKFQLVKDLVDQFPVKLYSETENVLGMPDAGDWGGIYIEIRHINDPASSGFWLLDQHEGHMPQVYNDFVDRINEKIVLINQ